MSELGSHFDNIDEEIYTNPNKFGMPTLHEYVKIRDEKMRKQRLALLESIDRGAHNLHKIKKYKFYIGNYQCSSLEQVERIAQEMGVDIYGMDGTLPYKAEVVDNGGLYGEIIVRFFSQSEHARRQSW